jgi:hypothetical protein
MNETQTNRAGAPLKLGSRAQLILQVALPRLATRAEEIEQLLQRPAPEGATALRESERPFPGEEGLAVLAALSNHDRRRVLEQYAASGPGKPHLLRIAELLGTPADPDTPAAALIRMYPEAAQPAADLVSDPEPVHEAILPKAPAADTPTIEQLVTIVSAWTDESAAVDALDRLTGPVLEFGSPLPATFWRHAADRLRASTATKRWPLLVPIAQVLMRQGESQKAYALLEEAAHHFDQVGSHVAFATATMVMADILRAQGALVKAQALFELALSALGSAGNSRLTVELAGRLADVLRAKGDLDGALRVRRERELPLYERLGDTQARAVTLGKIAELLEAVGAGDEASRIRHEEQVPVRERAGDADARRATELDIARRIQMHFLPKELPSLPGVQIAVESRPAQVNAGDFVDIVPAGKDSIWIAVGDAAGHGIPPALVVAQTRAYLRALLTTDYDVAGILTRLDQLLTNDLSPDSFITLFLARLDAVRGELTYGSAGHVPGYVIRRGIGVSKELPGTGAVLGVGSDCSFEPTESVQLKPGDILLAMTDGIIEARGTSGDFYGTNRAHMIVYRMSESAPRRILDALFEDVRAFSGSHPQLDDCSAVLVKWRG